MIEQALREALLPQMRMLQDWKPESFTVFLKPTNPSKWQIRRSN